MVKVFFALLLLLCFQYILAHKTVTMDYLKEIYTKGGILILDVREQDEYVEGHIPTSINFPLSIIDSNLDNVPRDVDIYVHCRSGYRSAQAAAKLDEYGIESVYDVTDGFLAWDGPVDKVPAPYYNTADGDYLLQHFEDERALIIDIRSAADYKAGHIPGAINMDYTSSSYTSLPYLKDIYVYGSKIYIYTHGVAKAIATAGHTNFFAVETSMEQWKGPVEFQNYFC